jgi:hypothetical protein
MFGVALGTKLLRVRDPDEGLQFLLNCVKHYQNDVDKEDKLKSIVRAFVGKDKPVMLLKDPASHRPLIDISTMGLWLKGAVITLNMRVRLPPIDSKDEDADTKILDCTCEFGAHAPPLHDAIMMVPPGLGDAESAEFMGIFQTCDTESVVGHKLQEGYRTVQLTRIEVEGSQQDRLIMYDVVKNRNDDTLLQFEPELNLRQTTIPQIEPNKMYKRVLTLRAYIILDVSNAKLIDELAGAPPTQFDPSDDYDDL